MTPKNSNKNFNSRSETAEKVRLSAIQDKAVELNFNGGEMSSDAGLLQLREIETQIHLLRDMAQLLNDERDQRYVQHSIEDLLLQRVMQIAAGYEDGNDCQTLRHDPVFKMLAQRQPESDPPLASQPTMSRFENSIRRTTLLRLAYLLAEKFVASYEEEPTLIVIDADDTEDTVYGGQQEALFNNYYKNHCYLPLHIYEGLSGKLITTILKPGKRATGQQMLGIVKRLVKYLRQAWPNTIIVFRGDSHFAYDEVMSWCEAQENVHYVLGLTGNAVLLEKTKPLLDRALNKYHTQRTQAREMAVPVDTIQVRLYHSIYYRAQSWQQHRRVIMKVEVTPDGRNIRYIITDLRQAAAQRLYEQVYCGRGQMELYIKEHKLYLKSDRTSCTRFEANQFRLFLHSAAYILIHAFRTNVLQHTEWANASIQTLRLRLLKIGARIRELKTCIKVELPTSFPLQMIIRRSFQLFAALPPTG
jgi:hypothetical protein